MDLRLIALVLALGACTAPFSAIDETLRASEVRTVALEERFTLYAPYDVKRSQLFVEVLDENIGALFGTLGVGFEEPIQVHAIALEMGEFDFEFDGEVITYSSTPRPPTVHEVRGFAAHYEEGEAPAVVFFVAKDVASTSAGGETLTHTFQFDYSGIVRHELAHLASSANLGDGPAWFDEGLALELEYTTLEAGRLAPLANPPTIDWARGVHAAFDLEELLDWQENGQAILKGKEETFAEGRPLAHAYMRFLLQLEGDSRSMSSFAKILAMSREEHLALAGAWHAWLEGPSESAARQ